MRSAITLKREASCLLDRTSRHVRQSGRHRRPSPARQEAGRDSGPVAEGQQLAFNPHLARTLGVRIPKRTRRRAKLQR
jgi:hypothetical protein